MSDVFDKRSLSTNSPQLSTVMSVRLWLLDLAGFVFERRLHELASADCPREMRSIQKKSVMITSIARHSHGETNWGSVRVYMYVCVVR